MINMLIYWKLYINKFRCICVFTLYILYIVYEYMKIISLHIRCDNRKKNSLVRAKNIIEKGNYASDRLTKNYK